MEPIISPIPREAIKAELTSERRLRHTNKAGNEIYVFTAHEAPQTTREIGRLREIAFRAAGGGTGAALDLDEFDLCEHPYYQLIVWNPDAEEILGGYRFLPGHEAQFDATGQPLLATSHMFRFSDHFIQHYLHDTIELGRSFVTLEYQSTRMLSKGLFALDNLWDGLGALTVIMPEVKYFFGKMTMYPSFPRPARDLILHFLRLHFGDKEGLVVPEKPVTLETSREVLDAYFQGVDFREDYRVLNAEVRKHGVNIPPLVNAYMSLSPTMRCFGTAVNEEFGMVEETGILIAIDEILEQKRMRHIDTFVDAHPESLEMFLKYFLKSPEP